MNSNYDTKNVTFVVLGVSVVLVLIIGLSFFLFFEQQEKNINEVVKNSVVTMNYKTDTNEFVLANLTPMANDIGKSLRSEGSYFDFSVSSKMSDDASVQYEISLVKTKNSTIPDEDVVVYLEKQRSGTYAKVDNPTVFTPIKKKTKLGSPVKSMVLYKANVSTLKEENYRLRLWIRDGAVVDPSAVYSVEVQVYGKAN